MKIPGTKNNSSHKNFCEKESIRLSFYNIVYLTKIPRIKNNSYHKNFSEKESVTEILWRY